MAGLTLAHALEKAKIDYVLLDKGIVAPPWGTSITIHPHGCRILHQIDCLDAVSDQCAPMEVFHQRDSSGRSFLQDNFFDAISARYVLDCSIQSLWELNKIYPELGTRRLPSREEHSCRLSTISYVTSLKSSNEVGLKTSSKRMEPFESSSETELNNWGTWSSEPTVYIAKYGSLCGGRPTNPYRVSSQLPRRGVRDQIPPCCSVNAPSESKTNRSAFHVAMVTTYNALIAFAPMQPGLGKYDMHCVSNDKFSFLILCQPDTIFFVAHCKLPADKQCRWPNRAQYTQEDMDALATKLADYPVSESLLYGELWRKRVRAHLVSLEEGVLEHWFFGRTALAGDSVHKVSLLPHPSIGHAFSSPSLATGNPQRRIRRLHRNGKRRLPRQHDPPHAEPTPEQETFGRGDAPRAAILPRLAPGAGQGDLHRQLVPHAAAGLRRLAHVPGAALGDADRGAGFRGEECGADV